MLDFEKNIVEIKSHFIKDRDAEDIKEWKDAEIFYLECNEDVAKYYLWLKSKNKKVPNKNNSSILYLMGVTDEKPRASLAKTGTTLPDIDFDTHRKNEVQEYLVKKFGKDKVTLMGTFLKLKVKSALKDVLRVLMPEYRDVVEEISDAKGNVRHITVKQKNENGMTAQEVNDFTKKFNALKIKEMDYKDPMKYVDDARKESKEIDEFFESNPHIYEILNQVLGAVKATGIHAGGVVVAADNVNRIVPCSYDRGKTEMWVTQPNMDYVESSGLIKYDFLGLNTLEDIWRAFLLIEKDLGIKLDFSNIPMNDPRVIRMFIDAKTESIFQFKTNTIRPILKKLSKIKNVIDLSIITSVGRPGPMEMGMHNKFVEIINKISDEIYFHPSMKDILGETYSIMCFQEQIMQVVVALADFTGDESVTVMKAMSKKKLKVLKSFKKRFIERSIKKYSEMGDFDDLMITNSETEYKRIRLFNNELDDDSEKLVNEYLIDKEQLMPLFSKKGEETSFEIKKGRDNNFQKAELINFELKQETTRKFQFYKVVESDGSISLYFNKITMILCEKIWAYMEAFAKYGFNKSHALAYSMKSYICMYLKVYYEIYWKTAVLTNIREKNNWKDEFKELYPLWKDKILKPNINESKKVCRIVEDDGIKKTLMSLSFINDIGDTAVEAIIKKQPYSSFNDFCSRVNSKVNKASIFNLINAGAFDIFCKEEDVYKFRKLLYKEYYDIVFSKKTKTYDNFKDYYMGRRKNNTAVSKEEKEAFDKLVEIKKKTKGQILADENRILNLSTFDYAEFYKKEAKYIANTFYKKDPISIKEALKKNNGEMVVIVGALKEEIKVFNTKNGKKMAMPFLINEKEEIRMTIWENNLQPNKANGFSLVEQEEGTPLVVFGKINHYNGSVSIAYYDCNKLA